MAVKQYHEIRDPIHDFVRLDSDERLVLNSGPIQRLRHIHQLAMSYLVYPGATHKRFEHSLGVMELAGRVFDVITADHNVHSTVREVVPEIGRSGGILKKCVNSQAVYPLSEQHGLKARERRYTAHEEGKHWE